jgi:hypothetical protein
MIDRYDVYGRSMEDTEPDRDAWFVRFDQHNDRIRELEAALRDAQNRLLQVTEPWLGARAAIIPAAVIAIVPILNEWQRLLRSPPSETAEPTAPPGGR